MQKKDALAVIDLAETCSIFESHSNYKATGVCYNNMANFQFKNESYNLAIKNYDNAILLAEICLGEKEPRVFFNKVCAAAPELSDDSHHCFLVTRAHRVY